MHESPSALRVLAVDPRIRRIGFTFVANRELQDWGVRNVRKGEPAVRLRQLAIPLLIGLLDRFEPQVLLVPDTKTGSVRRSALAQVAIEAVVREAKRRGIVVHGVTAAEITNAFRDISGSERVNRHAINLVIVARFPELTVAMPRARRDYDEEPYFGPLFYAASLYVTWRSRDRSAAKS